MYMYMKRNLKDVRHTKSLANTVHTVMKTRTQTKKQQAKKKTENEDVPIKIDGGKSEKR